MNPFPFDVFAAWAAGVLLMSLRVGPTLLATPLFSEASVPMVVRVALVVGLSTTLLASLGPDAAGLGSAPWQARARALAMHPGAFIESACTELALGATLALAVQAAFSAFAMAGRLLDVQVGFSLAEVFDPASNASLPVLATALNQAAVVVFFLANGHHALLRGLAFSLQRVPLGRPWALDGALQSVLRQFGSLFAVSFSLVAPVVFCLLITEFALGAVSRNLPQMNMISMGVPVKIVVGLAALALWLGSMGPVMDAVYKSIFTTWSGMLATPSATAPVAF